MNRLFLCFCFLYSAAVFAQEPTDKSILSDTATLQPEDDSIYTIVEQMPVFGEGNGDIYQFIGKTVMYPKEAWDQGIEGVVYLTFVVDEQGGMYDITILKAAHPLLDSAAIDAVRKMPNWSPGKQKDRTVKVQYTVPIKFEIAEKDKGKQ